MLLELNEEDFKMLKKELEYCRCLYWDSKLKKPEGYCDGECYSCKKDKKMLFDKWIESKIVSKENIFKQLPDIEHNYVCGYRSSCIFKDRDDILQRNICKTDNKDCIYLCPI